MAKYQIEYRCGHTIEKELLGKITQRESYIEYCKGIVCPECQRSQHHEKALADAQEKGYPELEGTSKQVSWAMDLRYTFTSYVDQEVQRNREHIERITAENEEVRTLRLERFDKQLPEFYELLNAMLAEKTSASYWIDNRSYINSTDYNFCSNGTPMELLRKYREEKQKASMA